MREYEIKDRLWDFTFILMMLITIPATGSLVFRTAVQMLFIGATILNFRVCQKETAILLLEKILFLCWGAISCLWAQFPEAVLPHMITLLQCIPLSVSVLLYVANGRKDRVNIALWMIVAGTLWMAALVLKNYSIATLLSGKLKLMDRLSVNGLNPNYLGMCASYSLLIVAGFRKRLRIGWGLTAFFAALFGMMAMLTGSRKAVLTILIGIVLLGAFGAKNTQKAFMNLMISATAVLAIWYIMMHVGFLYETIGYRFESLFGFFEGEAKDGSALSRSVMMRESWEIFKAHPIQGIGLYNYKYVGYYHRVSHCNYTELLSGVGIIGTLLYYGVQVGLMFPMAGRAVRGNRVSAVILILLFCKMVNEFFAVSYPDEMQQVIFMSFLGIYINDKYNGEPESESLEEEQYSG